MTPNATLSIPNALKTTRLLQQCRNDRLGRRRLPPAACHRDRRRQRCGLQDGNAVATAKEFVRFLVGEGWLAHYLDFAGERSLPPMPKLLDAHFGWTRAIPTACAPPCSCYSATLLRLCGCVRRLAAQPIAAMVPRGWGPLAGSRAPRRRRRHYRRTGGQRGDRPDQADPERVAFRSLVTRPPTWRRKWRRPGRREISPDPIP